jgi:hypothetical protein
MVGVRGRLVRGADAACGVDAARGAGGVGRYAGAAVGAGVELATLGGRDAAGAVARGRRTTR